MQQILKVEGFVGHPLKKRITMPIQKSYTNETNFNSFNANIYFSGVFLVVVDLRQTFRTILTRTAKCVLNNKVNSFSF